MHDEGKVREWLELMLPAFVAGRCEQCVEHTSGGSPNSRDEWPDPCQLAEEISPPANVDELLAFLPRISADTDRQAAEWCFDAYCEASLWDVCEGLGIPTRSIDDVSFATTFPVLTAEERMEAEARLSDARKAIDEAKRSRKRAKRARYEASRAARGLPPHRPKMVRPTTQTEK